MGKITIRSVLASLSLVAVLVFSGGTALAEEGRSPAYLGVGAGFGFEKFDDTGGIDPDEAYGFDVWGGYRIAPFVAAELQLEYLNGFDFEIFGVDVDGQALTFTGNLKVFPFADVWERVEPFAFTGIGVGWFEFDAGPVDEDDSGFVARLGGGVDVYVTENLALQASSSYVVTTGDIDDLDYVSLVAGLQYRF